ncbi:uncharacterized protein HMPREF1541_04581 [Cyphellophora europaea CBS 101466]|uniref:Subtelomeric hrmA-associated cluster protein AFUB-079030/YDR124W-like helical bundle domain-containing protein n=1 Tax=Cyphellophora europaea (strain CBS 101466) TaxID=1220924 RepID=W2RVG4_CYPE1|nr:uncharacterized protein HMPREF1541_04581 [Cyphellophora europaea CBS 101466]ETN40305.1 hypothetical protein HMPREF1541_04581 [Cyphellophora europaea CBS 101466]
MKQYRDMVLEPEAVDKFQHVLTDYIGGAALPLRQARADILQEPAKRRKNGKSRLRLPTSPPVGQMTSHARKSTKRSHPTIFESFDQRSFFLPAPKVETRSPGRGERKIPLLVNDWTAQAKWFSEAFKAVQQVGCRTIAKVWIKKIHPKKQSTHPYNGGLPRDLPNDANRTRPPYWPPGVIHKEPDHIDRNSRTSLLVHLIMHTPQQQLRATTDDGPLIFASDLLQALEEKKGDFKEDRWAIIQEIIGVREQLERFNDGSEYHDPSTVIHVSDFSEPARAKSEGDPDGDGDEEDKQEVFDEDKPVTSASSDTAGPHSPEIRTHDTAPRRIRADQDAKVHHPSHIPGTGRYTELVDDGPLVPSQQEFEASQVSSSDFLTMTTGQNQPSMSAHSVPFPSKSVVRIDPRRARAHVRPDMAFLSTMGQRQQPDMHAFDWMSANSPTAMLPVEYSFNGMQCQTGVPDQSFRMAGAAMGLSDRDMVGAGLPMADATAFQNFTDHSRPLPSRTMSASHASMMDPSMQDAHGFFYHG